MHSMVIISIYYKDMGTVLQERKFLIFPEFCKNRPLHKAEA